jgi:Leucine-rich repeat (LRR) protein
MITRPILFVFIFLLHIYPNICNGQVSPAELEALIAIYQSTDGDNWENNTGWDLTASPAEVNSNWYGITVQGGHVRNLNLSNNRLRGSIPPETGNLLYLRVLNLQSDPHPSQAHRRNQLEGNIPPEIGQLVELEWLRLFYNELSGPIPPQIGNLVKLTELNLGMNKLSGSLPPEIGNLTKLKELRLDFNRLEGEIPNGIGNFTDLERLFFGANKLSGSIPQSFGQLTKLRILDISANQISGSIPAGIGNLTQLTRLNLGNNQLVGTIPDGIQNLAALEELFLNNNRLTGDIPPGLWSLSKLKQLYLFSNELSGSILPEAGHLAALDELFLQNNLIGGSIPSSLGNLAKLRYLNLSSNRFTGNLPGEIGNMASLITLILDFNQLDGNIPPELGQLGHLVVMNLSANNFSGEIPGNIGNLTSLAELRLRSNQLSGQVPETFVSLKNLKTLSLHANMLSGLPDLSVLTGLEQFYVQNNLLHFDALEPNISLAPGYFTYSPQAKVGEEETHFVYFGEQLHLSVQVRGLQNIYQWYRNGEPIPGAATADLVIEKFTEADEGVYMCRINNSVATKLELVSENIYVNYAGAVLPSVNTLEANDITTLSAVLSGEVLSDGGSEISDRGFYWGVHTDPEISGIRETAGSGSGYFSAMLAGLTHNTTYHFRAYAINEAGTALGEVKSFKTEPEPQEFSIPNAFRPASEIPENRVFKPNLEYTPENYAMRIYNRWGAEVFFSGDAAMGWDGTIKNVAAPQGVYVFRIVYSDTEGNPVEHSGQLMLLR